MASDPHDSSLPGTCRVLVVDDDPTHLELMSVMLADLGYRVELAEDGAVALGCCHHAPPHAVLMDVQMPRLDGLEATRALRGLQRTGRLPAFPIIGTTALTSAEDVQRCLEAGMNACLLKPVQLSRLAQQLDLALNGVRQPQQSRDSLAW
jgi:CheY-like chemotaxis protein